VGALERKGRRGRGAVERKGSRGRGDWGDVWRERGGGVISKGGRWVKKKAKSDSKLYFLCFCVAIKIIKICLFFSLNFSKIKNDNIFPISNHIKN